MSPIHFPHAALADEGGDFVGAEAGAWAEGHGASGNGAAILPPVGLSGTHNGRAGFAGSGAASDWLSQAHVRMLSDDPSLPTSFDRHDSFPARSIPRRAETLPSQRAIQGYIIG